MLILDNDILQNTYGGDFCSTFAGVTIVLRAGALANLWNPAGQAATAVGLGIAAACWLHHNT